MKKLLINIIGVLFIMFIPYSGFANNEYISPDEFVDAPTWNTFVEKLPWETPIIIKWNGYGGYNNIAKQVFRELQKHKNITLVITNMAASNHANAACLVPTVLTEDAHLLFHMSFRDSPAIFGGKHYSTDKETIDYMTNIFNKCIAKGYFTEKDKQLILINHKAIVIYIRKGILRKIIRDDD